MSENHIIMKELPVSERPYEKLEKYGPGALSDAELLAVIIRTGTKTERCVEVAARLLTAHKEFPGLLGLLKLSLPELRRIRGIGRVKAIQIKAVAELTRRMAKATMENRLFFNTPETIAEYYMQDMRSLEVEKAMLLMLNTKSKLIKDTEISLGTVSSSLISPREVFLEALKYGAVYIILVHNHPSGDPEPSNADLMITSRVREAGNLIGIKLMDHVIIGDNKYISLKQKGFL